MIKINQKVIDISQLNHVILSSGKFKILEFMDKYSRVYEYETISELEFELGMRLQIIQAARLLNKSGVKFATFKTSKCNEEYWRRTNKGAFELKVNVSPQTGIEDIFLNGKKYAFECATAIVIIFYKAILDTINEEQFNRLFLGLILYDWQYDQDLELIIHEGTDFLPGDCVYFNNPDYDPKTPEWQGENAIVLDDDLYFGHGIGIGTSTQIIGVLNSKRKRNFEKSSYLSNHIVGINFNHISNYRLKKFRKNSLVHHQFSDFSNLIVSEIGSKIYLL
ncbi:protein-glutamine gamma-glutamyltransferase [Jeotgalibacillus soli]|uniref:Protein-glutamine gamma-glutamyltransferase n=1 Tax=Jeotgalibacillus soli TaxID=889306 RepID=A0A0C2RTY0_9BACL|nr:protein-glutamine gamma-glutamyltransferase [Jeotgalibacillus soli]KIL45204.1 protein-glutamine gamma-glutamyltransferase [Jeotgalibacillus soli]